ncbi:MAG: efflux RND transporter permease subunit [Chloroflexota bacterium]
MSRLSLTALSKRSVTLLFAAALFIAGISAWGSLKQELLPDIDFPIVTVVTPFPGAGSSDVTEQVTKPIENAISGIARLELVQSTSSNSISLVVAQFSYGTNVKDTTAAITDAINKAKLPSTATPTVQALNINASPVVVSSIASTGTGGLAGVAEIARLEIVPELEAIDGVARVDLTGGLEQRLFVTLDPKELAAASLTSQQVVGVLQANNLTVPSGQIPTDGSKVPVSTIGTLASEEEIRALVVGFTKPAPAQPSLAPTGSLAPSPGPSQAAPAIPKPITIGDLGTVGTELVATTGFGRTNGDQALTVTVSKQSNANTVEVADAVQAKLAEIGTRHKDQLTVTTVADLSVFIKESANGLVREGGLGAVFAILTIFLFLFSIRATVVAAISIPLSILTALVIMQLTGVTINIMTLGGLAVAVGRVVDDAIVVLENIYRHRSLGEDRRTASINGPREVAGAITASTLTTVAVFLPLGFVGGLVSQFFLPFALTVTFALLASLVCALTVVPVLAFFLIRDVRAATDETGEPTRSFWVRAYTPAIRFVLRGRATKLGVVAVAAILFFASAALAPLLPTQFINAGSEATLVVTVSPPTGATSAAVLERTIEAETILLADPEVELVQTSIPAEGDTSSQVFQSALQGRAANSATMTVKLKQGSDVDAASARLATALEPVKTDGYDATVSSGGFSAGGLNVVVTGQTKADVDTATTAILASLADQPDLVNLKSNLVKATPEVQVTVDPNKAITVGMTAAQVAGQVRGALVAQTATSIQSADGQTVQVVVQLDPAAVASVDDLKILPVGTVATVPLETIATVEQVEVQGSITRIDQRPAASITAEIAGDDTGAVSKSVQAELDALEAAGTFPPGTTAELAGVSQQQSEAFGGLFASMGVAVLLVYVMMVLAFNSLLTPFIILFSLPLATIGAFTALFVTGRPIGVSALIGFLMLIGIVVTNAIVLLDLVERLRGQGVPLKDAIIEGGRTRVRPILMTAFATILALIPLAAGFNQGSIIAAELGTVVIGGLFSSTLLTLIVVPVLYYMVESTKDSIRRRFDRAPQVAPPTPIAEPEPAV